MNPISMGVDISKWQGDFYMNRAVNEGFKFVIIKAGGSDGGLYKDIRFIQNYNKAEKLGIPKGAYWYSRALTVSDAVREAEYFYTYVLKNRKFELPVYMDVEETAQASLGKRRLTDIVLAWCSYIESKGYLPGIYASIYFFENNLYDNELAKYEHWVAQWSKSCTYKNPERLGMWQFGGETNKIRSNRVAGVVCDQNYMYKDYPAIIKAAGKNGFTAGTGAGVKLKSTDEIAKEVIAGKWGNGEVRKQKLTKAGYDYQAVQKRVNELLRS